MEGEGTEAQIMSEALTTGRLVNRSKVEHLLSPLKSSANRHVNLQMEEMLKKEIGDLKMQVLRERMKNKRMKLCSLFELLLQLAVLFFLVTILLLLAFAS